MLLMMPSFSASSSLLFLKMMMRLCSMIFLMMRSTAPISGCFSFTRVVCICFSRATIVSSFVSAGAFVIAMPMLSSRFSSARLSGRKSSRKPSMAFFQGMILVRVDFSSMKMRKPTRLVRATIRSTVSFCSSGPHFLFSGGQMKEGTSTSLNSSLSFRDFSQSAGQAVCILMDLLEMTPSRLQLDLTLSKDSPGVIELWQYLRTSSAKVVLPVWLGPMRRMHCGMLPRQFQLLTVLATVILSSISTNKKYKFHTCIAFSFQKELYFIQECSYNIVKRRGQSSQSRVFPKEYQYNMSFRTNKCTHGEKGMCIHCMVNRQRQEKKGNEVQIQAKLECKHAPHMKCLRCLPAENRQAACLHPDYEICKRCQHMLKYQKFCYFLEALRTQCQHRKPCGKCVPPLSRKTYFIDTQCRRHLPYPQALCDACMPPTLTVAPQRYAHLSRVIVRTREVYRVVDAKCVGVLLGRIVDDVVFVENVYFPEDQAPGGNYLSPEAIGHRNYLFGYFNLREIGLLYCSPRISGLELMLSSLLQWEWMGMEEGQPVPQGITMRLQLQGEQPHFECFMVSDQFQALHRNGLVFEREGDQDYFDLAPIRTPEEKSRMPTFLRGGVETDRLYFKEAIVWIPTVQEEGYECDYYYPTFTLELQTLENMREYLERPGDPLEKYRNIQFLLHLEKLIAREGVERFLREYYLDQPDLFLRSCLQQAQKKEKQSLRAFGRGIFQGF